MTKQGDFRAAFLSAAADRKKEKVEWQGFEVEVREPSAKERAQIRKNAMKIQGENIQVDQGELEVWSVIFCAYDRESGERIFHDADHDALLNLGAATLDTLARKTLPYISRNVEEAAKN